MRHRRVKRALVAIELLVIVAVLGALAAFLALSAGAARHRAHVAGSITNLQQFGAGAGSFAADNADRWFSFSWHRGEVHQGADGYVFPAAENDNQAFADQAVAIIRDRGHRPDITQITGWVAPILYTHLALVDYLGQSLPAEFAASPSDHNLLAWQRASREPADQGAAYFALRNRPDPGASSAPEKRWPYSSSYRVGPSFYSPDAIAGDGVMTFSQATTHRQYYVGDARTVLGVRRTSEVAYPGNKAMMFEGNAEDQAARRYFYAYDQVRTPILFADGSATVRSMSGANRGFDPNSPSPIPTRINYQPEPSWEPPTVNGGSAEFVYGRVQWTRSGLRGRDFGGPEVPWVP